MTIKEKLKTFWAYLTDQEPEPISISEPKPTGYELSSPNFISFELIGTDVRVTMGTDFKNKGEIGFFARLLNDVTTGKQNVSIIRALQASNCLDEDKKTLINAWTFQLNMDKLEKIKTEPLIKPSQVIKS